ncbi:hypothetical protein ABZY06_30045 [Streptomyces sp. NPDC006540]|uniref:hypothetical protein n=1 Tax=Streptomyces sp. NPDC006540 TaxID=3155353 RepID=UPI0033A7C74E
MCRHWTKKWRKEVSAADALALVNAYVDHVLTAGIGVERQLITDATDRGREREIDRHQRLSDRITSLFDDLGEPHDESAD